MNVSSTTFQLFGPFHLTVLILLFCCVTVKNDLQAIYKVKTYLQWFASSVIANYRGKAKAGLLVQRLDIC